MKKGSLLLFLCVIWIAFIWTNSFVPGHLSSNQSGFVTQVVRNVLSLFQIDVSQEIMGSMIRTLAHFIEFMVLGILLSLTVNQRNLPIYFVFIGGLSVAMIDEVIQVFVPGRAFEWIDLTIDALGLILGMLIALAIMMIQRKRRHSLEQTSNS